jgi:indole-3-glycerol phosphate synthase
VGTLGELVAAGHTRAATLRERSAELGRAAIAAPPVRSLRAELQRGTVGIIAEVKRASPSRGPINPELRAADQALAYDRGGAFAISVLTEPSRFGGNPDDIVAARSATDIPILKKDFHVEPVQLLEARALGCSAALIIVRAVDPTALVELLNAGKQIGLELLVEVQNETELDLALAAGAEIIGVNNRNLESLAVDLAAMDRLLPLIPASCAAVAESGIETREDIERAGSYGADAVLIGSVLSGSATPELTLRSLTGVKRVASARQN